LTEVTDQRSAVKPIEKDAENTGNQQQRQNNTGNNLKAQTADHKPRFHPLFNSEFPIATALSQGEGNHIILEFGRLSEAPQILMKLLTFVPYLVKKEGD
jgi:hypothetical protein